MTVCVGVLDRERGKVVLAVDSQSSNGWIKGTSAIDKMFRNGPLLVAGCGSWRLLNLLKHDLAIDRNAAPADDRLLEEWLVLGFAEIVRKLAHERGLSRVAEAEHSLPGGALVAIRGTLWMLDSDFQVNRPAEGYAADGSGAYVALGALAATARLQLPPRQRAQLAVQAAILHAPGVGGPVRVAST